MARKRSASGPQRVTLRLLENHYIDGKVRPAGTTMEFSEREAEYRLSKTQLWVIA